MGLQMIKYIMTAFVILILKLINPQRTFFLKMVNGLLSNTTLIVSCIPSRSIFDNNGIKPKIFLGVGVQYRISKVCFLRT